MDKKEEQMDRKTVAWVSVAVLYTLLLAVLWPLWGYTSNIGDFQLKWGLLWLGTVIAYTLASFTNTGLSERAIKLLLGIPIQEIAPGRLIFIPLGFYRLERMRIEIQQMELPGEPEQIWRAKDEKDRELPLGIDRDGKPVPPPKKDGKELPWVQPIRVPFDDENPFPDDDPLGEISKLLEKPVFRKTPGTPSKKGRRVKEGERGEDPTSKRVTTEVSGILQWRVWGLATFIRSFGIEGSSIRASDIFRNAEKQLADIAVSEMSGALQMGTLGRALANQGLLGHYIAQRIRERLGHKTVLGIKNLKTGVVEENVDHPRGETVSCRRGVEIVNFQLKSPNLSQELNRAIQRILEAKAKAGATIREAEGDNQRMTLLNNFAGTPGGEMMILLERLRTIRESIGQTGDKIILVDGKDPLAGLFGAFAGGRTLLGTTSTSSGTAPPTPPTP